MKNMLDIQRLTLSEYSIRMLAFNLHEIDETFKRRELAWSIRSTQLTDKNQEYIYQDFKDFFDYEKAIDEVLNKRPQEEQMDPDLVRIAKRVQAYRRQQEGG